MFLICFFSRHRRTWVDTTTSCRSSTCLWSSLAVNSRGEPCTTAPRSDVWNWSATINGCWIRCRGHSSANSSRSCRSWTTTGSPTTIFCGRRCWGVWTTMVWVIVIRLTGSCWFQTAELDRLRRRLLRTKQGICSHVVFACLAPLPPGIVHTLPFDEHPLFNFFTCFRELLCSATTVIVVVVGMATCEMVSTLHLFTFLVVRIEKVMHV